MWMVRSQRALLSARSAAWTYWLVVGIVPACRQFENFHPQIEREVEQTCMVSGVALWTVEHVLCTLRQHIRSGVHLRRVAPVVECLLLAIHIWHTHQSSGCSVHFCSWTQPTRLILCSSFILSNCARIVTRKEFTACQQSRQQTLCLIGAVLSR